MRETLVHHFVSVIPRPSNLTAEDAREGLFQLSWTQEGVMDEFIIHWKTENGPEYNTSTDSNQIEFNVSDSRITSATWYYISVVAVAGEETSSTSDTLRVGTGEFICIIHYLPLWKEVMFLDVWVYLFVDLSVCLPAK